ncbi:unnamed protein product, partial [Effrenium voratum]
RRICWRPPSLWRAPCGITRTCSRTWWGLAKQRRPAQARRMASRSRRVCQVPFNR